MKRKITFLYLFFGSISVIFVGFILYFSLSRVLVNESISSTQTAVMQTGRYLEIYVDQLNLISDTLVKNQDVVEYFSHNEKLTSTDYEKRINQSIANIIDSNTSLQSVTIISHDGKIFSNEDNLNMSMSEDMMKEAWYIDAITNNSPILTSARMQQFSMDKNLWVISLSQEVVDISQINIGVAVIDVPYTALESYLMDLHLGEEGYAFILNSDLDVVFHPDQTFYQDEEKKKELAGFLSEPEGYQRGADRFFYQYQIQNTDWTLVAVSSVDGLSILRRQVFETVLIGLSIILIVVLVTGVILKRLTAEIKTKEKDIHHLEMNALYSQINPHFLYNTLDTIVWMAEFNQKDDIIHITKSLAQFFRLSLNQGSETTSLGNEIEHAKQYLYIQKQRYQDKLSYQFQYPDSVLDLIVPKIILQPILENSIYHGIKDKDGTGMITIDVQEDNSYIFITVKDNGIGFQMSEKDLPDSSKPKLGGVGLKNVEQRIKLFCSNDSGITITSKLGFGTEVTLKICKICEIKSQVEH